MCPLAYTYASLFGVVTEAEYPYSSGYYGHTDPCIFDAKQTPVSVMTMGWETLPRNDMLATMHHLAHKVSMYFFPFYKKTCYVRAFRDLWQLLWLHLNGACILAVSLMAVTMMRTLL